VERPRHVASVSVKRNIDSTRHVFVRACGINDGDDRLTPFA